MRMPLRYERLERRWRTTGVQTRLHAWRLNVVLMSGWDARWRVYLQIGWQRLRAVRLLLGNPRDPPRESAGLAKARLSYHPRSALHARPRVRLSGSASVDPLCQT